MINKRVTITIRKLEREILASGGSVCIVTTTSGNSENTNLVEEHENRRVIFMDNSLPIPFQSDPNDPTLSYHLGISLSKNIQEQMDEFQPNIIHITAPDFTSLHVNNYARKRQIPLMGTYHSNIPEYMLFVPGMSWVKPVLEMLFRHIYNFLLRLYVPTPFIRNMLIDQQSMDQVTEIGVWGRGVDLQKFKPENRTESFRTKLNIPKDCPVVLYVGRVVPEKRPDIVANVIKRLTAQNVTFRCVIVGAGPADNVFKNLPHTHLLGWLSGDELTEAYASSDIFLFPSSVETFGNVTLEAAASGLPLVVESKCSGHLVDHGGNGYACTAGNLDEFYQGTLELCQNAEKRKAFSQKSLEKSSILEQSKVVKTMLDNYQEVRKDFYDKFGGNHYNRDEAYRHDGSFTMGMDPRPFGWLMVEYVVIVAINFVNGLQAFATWFQARGSGNSNSTQHTEDDDIEVQILLSETVEAEEEDTSPGILCNVLIAIGDSSITAKIVMFIIGCLMFVSRLISILRRGVAKRVCSKAFESIEHRMDAAFNANHEKRKD
jgi:glycosyltransferase involved in cell wall biosynthesis